MAGALTDKLTAIVEAMETSEADQIETLRALLKARKKTCLQEKTLLRSREAVEKDLLALSS